MRKCVLVGALLALSGCHGPGPSCTGKLWPEADALFHSDTRWIGSDGAYSIDLGNQRVLWLFGDTFIASSDARVRRESKMVRNSVAIQTGYDPSRAFIEFSWPEKDQSPESFLPEDGQFWYWPAHGIRLDDALLLFFERVRSPADDPSGFEGAGFTAKIVHQPDLDPSAWQLEDAKLPASDGSFQLGEAVLRVGDFVYVYATGGNTHELSLARFSVEDAKNGDLTQPAWWTGQGFEVGGSREALMSWGSPEFSVHFQASLGKYVMVDTQGYGPTTLAIRSADQPEGPWSEPRDVMRPPESFDPNAFDYAGKAHPELLGAEIVMTYVPSTFDSPAESDESRYYYPRFVRAECD